MEKLVRFFSVPARNVQENSRPGYIFCPVIKEGLDKIDRTLGQIQANATYFKLWCTYDIAFFGVAAMD
jgi:hypothetical protein